jgi:hypothetical protein
MTSRDADWSGALGNSLLPFGMFTSAPSAANTFTISK